ncbi:MAG: SIS domain-containing protein [Clostridiales bacterium]|nr:SIS domain-containing protein [Clostridiales bacterium]
MEQKTTANLIEYVVNFKLICDQLPVDDIARMVDILWNAVNEGKAIYTMGNGGHCNTASHMINDLAKHTSSSDDKKAVVADNLKFRTMCLNDSMSFVTGLGNDMGFDSIFSEQIANWVQPGDVVIGISGSGNSENILKAFRVAKSKGATSICLAGFKGGKSKDEADLCIVVPCNKMVMVEDFHLMISHMVADELKKFVQKREVVLG